MNRFFILFFIFSIAADLHSIEGIQMLLNNIVVGF